MCCRSWTAAHSRVHATEPVVQSVLEIGHRHVVHVDLADLRNDDEPFPTDGKLVGLLDVAGKNQCQLIAWINAVIRVNRPGEIGVERARSVAEEIESEDHEAAVCSIVLEPAR